MINCAWLLQPTDCCMCCVPVRLLCRFELLCRIRIARGFGALTARRQLVKQRLLAFNVLLQCSPTAGEAAGLSMLCHLASCLQTVTSCLSFCSFFHSLRGTVATWPARVVL